MGDYRHIGSKLSRISRGRVPLYYSSRIKGQSVGGSRSGNWDEEVIMDMSTSAGW